MARTACSTASVSTITMFLPGFSVHDNLSAGGAGSWAEGWAARRSIELCALHIKSSIHSLVSPHSVSLFRALHFDTRTNKERGH
jgi:hypothetical protein